jgi:DNA-binding response OmpR family regulator
MSKVLIVEDDNFLANAYRVKLTKSGFEVKMARDGNEALETLASFVPDAIVLDLVMPRKDGFQTLEEIMKNPTWKNIPVIIASNLSQKEDIQKGMKLGARDYFIKSDLSLEHLIEKIHKLIKK